MNRIAKIGISAAIVLLAAVPVFTDGFSSEEESSFVSDCQLGTADTPEGTTLVLSVFVNDRTYSWNPDSSEDQETMDRIDSYLKVATEYLTDAVSAYGIDADFIYDFRKDGNLLYYADFDAETTENDSADAEDCMNQFIDAQIDTDALKDTYQADNVVYFMFVNTDLNSPAISCTRNYYEGMEHPYEIVFLYNVDSGLENGPAVYAHEMLHTFGAPDLYSTDGEYGITQEFVDWVQENTPNDIMYNCSDMETGDYLYDRISNDFTELDAYYVGLTDSCQIVDTFHLGESQHISQNS